MIFVKIEAIYSQFRAVDPAEVKKTHSWVNVAPHVHVSREQVQVGGKKTSTVLEKLQPNTLYSIKMVAVYSSGVSKDLSGDGKTSKKIRVFEFNDDQRIYGF